MVTNVSVRSEKRAQHKILSIMRKVCLLISGLLFCLTSVAQINVPEPDFIGDVIYVSEEGNAIPLEKTYARVKVRDKFKGLASMLSVEGDASRVRLKSGEIQLIVRAVDNHSDPMSIVRVFEFSAGKKQTRVITLAQGNDFTRAVSYDDYRSIMFSGKKYGESSYLLTINSIAQGEYGIIVKNPNSVDEKIVIVSCFGVE